MKKLNITTLASVAVNIILSLWLVNQYFYDAYFHTYVDSALGPVYPFIVLTIGLGGGSSLGYLLLKRRHAEEGGIKLEKARLFKSSGPVQSATGSQNKVMPTGPPPGQVSRHTAYAVPPLPKGSSSSSGAGRTTTSSTAVGAKSVTSSPAPQREQITLPSTSILNSTLRDQFRPEPGTRAPPSSFPSPPILSRNEIPQTINRIPSDSSRTSVQPSWKAESTQTGERATDSTVFPKPGLADLKPGGDTSSFMSSIGQVPKPPQPSQTPFTVSKWTPPDQKSEGQWTDPVPKPGLAAPQKWTPPSQGFPPRPPQGIPPRPGAGPPPLSQTGQRPPFLPSQGGPRPLGFPSGPRPLQPGPLGVSPAFRSDAPRPSGPPFQNRPPTSPGAAGSSAWAPQKGTERADTQLGSSEKDLSNSSLGRSSPLGASETSRPSDNRVPEPSSAGGEMDWDTALDTILKTLKKDRGVGEKT